MRRLLDVLLVPPGTPEMGGGARISRRTLDLIRWAAVVGQAATILIVHFLLGFPLALGPALLVVAASVLVNLANLLRRDTGTRLRDRGAALYLGYDILQLAVLLFLTGGLHNPFAMLMLAPVTIAATILSQRSVLWLSSTAIGAISVLAVAHEPLPWAASPLDFPPEYIFGVWAALTLSTAFTAAYTWSVSGRARRMRDAFAETQLALAREQRVSAVGALAAAAAHELGSPLATIAVVAKELVRELPPGSPFAEDAALLLSQSERCRTILAELAHQPYADRGEPFTKLPVSSLVEAAGAPHRAPDIRVIYATATGGDSNGGDMLAVEEPRLPRSPEILHGLGNLIQNAIQFAQREVTVTTFWSEDAVHVDITDDGLGFPANVLARVGEPYLSSRAGVSGHMGLGIFIAQTLLERTGARLTFENLPEGGAHVAIGWDRANLEAGSRGAVEEKELVP
jgi:two-component system sensor histidine kinase RegB